MQLIPNDKNVMSSCSSPYKPTIHQKRKRGKNERVQTQDLPSWNPDWGPCCMPPPSRSLWQLIKTPEGSRDNSFNSCFPHRWESGINCRNVSELLAINWWWKLFMFSRAHWNFQKACFVQPTVQKPKIFNLENLKETKAANLHIWWAWACELLKF